MATVQQIREELRVRLATISGLRPHANLPDDIVSPAAVVFRSATVFDSSTDSDDLQFAVTVFIDWTDARRQEKLDAYTAGEGASSIRLAIDADPTLGGVVDWCRVARVEPDRIAEYSSKKYLAADIIVDVG